MIQSENRFSWAHFMYALPWLAAVAVVLWVLWKGLFVNRDDQSIIKGKAFPEFSLADLKTTESKTLQDLKEKISIVHIWASWCGVCVKEHDEWLKITQKWHYPLVGVVYRDNPVSALNILKQKGDPYTYLLNDQS